MSSRRTLKVWHVIVFLICFGLVVCGLAGYLFGPDTEPSNKSINSSAPASVSAPAPVSPAAPKVIVVKGKGNSVVQTPSVLKGTFELTYAFGDWCAIANFLRPDGNSGANFLEDINECANDVNAKLSGSTIVHLTGVSQVKVSNTEGDWSLTFKPIG